MSSRNGSRSLSHASRIPVDNRHPNPPSRSEPVNELHNRTAGYKSEDEDTTNPASSTRSPTFSTHLPISSLPITATRTTYPNTRATIAPDKDKAMAHIVSKKSETHFAQNTRK